MDPILNHLSPVHILTHCFFNIDYNITLTPTPSLPTCSVHMRFSE
jgi:hypothetical protein